MRTRLSRERRVKVRRWALASGNEETSGAIACTSEPGASWETRATDTDNTARSIYNYSSMPACERYPLSLIMYPTGKTLVDIASVSRRVFETLIRCAGRKTVESFQLEKIVVASGAILETLNGALLLGSGTIDDRLKDWLSGEEPKRCLDILNRMEVLLGSKLDHGHGVRNFFQSSRSMSTKDKSNEAIRLFWKHESYFHFLLSTEIW
jgi:hypothetical protein